MKNIKIQAKEIDDFIASNGLEGLIPSGLSRFKFVVNVRLEEGSVFSYNAAYCVTWGDHLLVFPEHHEIAVYNLVDIYHKEMLAHTEIPRIVFKENIVSRHDEDDLLDELCAF
jgi:hypothetical protein